MPFFKLAVAVGNFASNLPQLPKVDCTLVVRVDHLSTDHNKTMMVQHC